jgi:hypothetical protein
MGYFLGIPLLARVKIPILKDTPKKYSIREDFLKIKIKKRGNLVTMFKYYYVYMYSGDQKWILNWMK